MVSNNTFIFLELEVRGLKWVVLGYSQGVSRALFLLETLGGTCVFAFPASRGHPHSVACGPPIFKARNT